MRGRIFGCPPYVGDVIAVQDTYVPNSFFILTFTDRVQTDRDQRELSFDKCLDSTGEAVSEILSLLDTPASSMLGVSMAWSVFPKFPEFPFTVTMNLWTSLLEATTPIFRRLLDFRGSRMRPEPDEALRQLQERCKTGRASLTSTCNDLL